MVGALLGGLISAPVAAFIVRLLPTRIMSTAVGGFILVVNVIAYFEVLGISPSFANVLCSVLVAVWIAALAFAIVALRRDRAVTESQPA